MLSGFYFTCLPFILLFLAIALLNRKRETVHRALTLLALLHLFTAVMAAGVPAVTVLAAIIGAIAVDELRRAYGKGRAAVYAAACLSFVAFGLFLEPLLPWSLIGYGAITFLTFAAAKETISHPAFAALFAAFIVCLGIVAFRGLYAMEPGAMIALIMLLQFNDAFGYLAGKALGRTKPFPRLSPGKSVEGYAGGVAAVVLGLVFLHTTVPVLAGKPLWNSIAIGLFIVLFGNAGDLLLSAVKRKLGLKDFSALLPGHGGILDRFDNILFASPPFYLLWHWLVSG
ncbi:phosphatidate cytidylyltransferase [Paenibacillus sp. MBLB4367]|uniref:phosphatidate cytidylyltransferase n=1 Tax=Paenibacillus sp. MBLB4367 TaxID=3384767 RepID=UPI0039083EB3